MKTLSQIQTKVDGDSFTITGKIIEKEFSHFLVRRVTIGHINPDNRTHVRHLQISDEAIFVKLPNTKFGLAITPDDLVGIATAIEPKTSFCPVFKKSGEPLTVEIASELSPDFQWQVSDEINVNQKWSDISGATAKTLDPSMVKKGQWVRCAAKSDAGSMTSNPAQIK